MRSLIVSYDGWLLNTRFLRAELGSTTRQRPSRRATKPTPICILSLPPCRKPFLAPGDLSLVSIVTMPSKYKFLISPILNLSGNLHTSKLVLTFQTNR